MATSIFKNILANALKDGGTYRLAGSNTAITAPEDTETNILVTVTIPGGSLGPNGRLDIYQSWSFTGSANAKIREIKFGGTSFYATNMSSASNVGMGSVLSIVNRNSEASQITTQHSSAFSNGASYGTTGTDATGTINTAVDQTLTISIDKGLGSETVLLNSWAVYVTYGA